MRAVAIALVAMLLAVALHAVAMGLWHDGHSAPFHSGTAMLTCPMGYVCPVSPAALRAAFSAPTPEGFKTLITLFLAFAAVLCAGLVERSNRAPPHPAAVPNSPQGLRSIFKKE